ncbi:MAG TPA: helix-turn-helix domain-containing protein [Solirubrobacteraceae bacterium]|jgi:transcriptional regulator with XRE-family HTH domain|nr:helix-turn-helix domain-containing protein [Solirubrobacteraceae bacterium]
MSTRSTRSGDGASRRRAPAKTTVEAIQRAAAGRPAVRRQTGDDGVHGLPNVGEIVKRLRLQYGLSLRELAERSGLSTSFLSSVERGESDIAVGRLARVAECLDHDIGSLLGYSSRRSRPHFVAPSDYVAIERGDGIDYKVVRLATMGLELITVSFAPHSAFTEDISHEGVDAVHVLEGQIVLTLDHIDYTLAEGECVVFSAAYQHGMRNERDEWAFVVSVTDAEVY